MSGISGIRPVTEEVKKIAFEKVAQVSIYNLHLIAQIIDLSCKRGAFMANEMSIVGTLFDIIASGVNKSYDIADEEIKKNELLKTNETESPLKK